MGIPRIRVNLFHPMTDYLMLWRSILFTSQLLINCITRVMQTICRIFDKNYLQTGIAYRLATLEYIAH